MYLLKKLYNKFCGRMSVMFVVFFFSYFTTSAQGNIAPCFNSVDTIGCVPFTVKMRECTGGAKNIKYNFGLGYDTTSTFTYTKPGVYSVKQTIENTNSNVNNVIEKKNFIRVVAPTNPSFRTYTCDNFAVAVQLTDIQFKSYLIDFGDGTSTVEGPNVKVIHFYTDNTSRTISVTGMLSNGVCPMMSQKEIIPQEKVQRNENLIFSLNSTQNADVDVKLQLDAAFDYDFYTLNGNLVYSINNLNGPINFVLKNLADSCVYYTVTNACEQVFTSEPTCFSQLKLNPTEKSIDLNWKVSLLAQVKQIEIYQNSELLATLSSGAETYIDTTVRCTNSYCYTLKSYYLNGTITESKACTTAQVHSKPEDLDSYKASFNAQNQLVFTWTLKKGNVMSQIELTNMSGTQIFKGFANTYILNNYTINDCYKLQYSDSCGLMSDPSEEICPIYLAVQTQDVLTYNLSWTAYQPSSQLKEYQIIVNDSLWATTTALDFQLKVPEGYIVRKIYISSSLPVVGEVRSNYVEIQVQAGVYFPTAFSPNGDGQNDTFFAIANHVQDLKWAIYNIWGQLIFVSQNNEPWSGADAQVGTYNYIATYTDPNGKKHTKRDFVVLLK